MSVVLNHFVCGNLLLQHPKSNAAGERDGKAGLGLGSGLGLGLGVGLGFSEKVSQVLG